MELRDIKDIVSKYVKTISKILDVSVTVIDRELCRVANTYPYLHTPTTVRWESIVGVVISTGKPMAVDNISNYAPCKRCPDFQECSIEGVIAVPVICQGEILGAFCVMVPKSRSSLFLNLNSSIDFLENMADLLAEKLISAEQYQNLKKTRFEQQLVMEAIEDAVAFTGPDGELEYFNGKFESLFSGNENLNGRNIAVVIQHPAIREMLQLSCQLGKQLIFFENGGRSFYGIVYCYPKNFDAERRGILFVFRNIHSLETGTDSLSPGQAAGLLNYFWMQGREIQTIMDRAKLLAASEEPVLILGEAGTRKKTMAKVIHSLSTRSSNSFIIMDCATMTLEAPKDLDRDLFGCDAGHQRAGALGKIHLAHRGTLLFANISQMPPCCQETLADFLETGRMPSGFHAIPDLDVRLLFTCCEDIRELVENGYFCEALYRQIAHNTLQIPPIRIRKRSDVARLVEKSAEWAKENHHKPRLRFESEALELLYAYAWPGNITELDTVISRLVYSCQQCVTVQDVQRMGIQKNIPAEKSIEALEMERIQWMIAQGFSREVIAQTLGLSRATVYRRLRKYAASAKPAPEKEKDI